MSLSPRFYCILRDVNYNRIALFDNWIELKYTNTVNGVGSFSIKLGSDDPKVKLFQLDGLFEIYRRVSNVAWYREGIYLCRSDEFDYPEKGANIYIHSGVGLNDFLSRTIINYPAATIKSYKLDPAETCMKEYVEENCGATATLAEWRDSDGVLPDFIVEHDNESGPEWEGDRAYKNLLEVLQEIAKFSDIDFNVDWTELGKKFVFKTYANQLGSDRTTIGLSPITGKNSAGNVPVIFSKDLGNVKSINKSYNRSAESNVVSVLGDGDGATREVQVRFTQAKYDSPWNRREVSRPQSGYESEMKMYGDSVLADSSSKEVIEFAPLSQEGTLYGKHFFFGDRVSILFRDIYYHKRITEVSNTVVNMKEDLKFTFSDLK